MSRPSPFSLSLISGLWCVQEVLTSKEIGLQVHLIERVDGLVIVGLDLTCRQPWIRNWLNPAHAVPEGASL
jgi:hypothetical protein